MWNTLKALGQLLVMIGLFCLALGIGATISALGAILSAVAVGAVILIVLYLGIKELLENNSE